MPRLLALAACGVGAAMIVVGLRLSALGRDTRSYTRTRGRVVASYLDELPGLTEEGGPKFRSVVRYAYDARGRSYESERVAVGSSAGTAVADRDEARAWVERFPAGSEVDVWFDPFEPSRAVLVRGVSPAQVLAAVVIGLALVGLGLFRLARR